MKRRRPDSMPESGDIPATEVPIEDAESPFGDEPIVLPVEETLDLHTFHPREVKTLVPDYLDEAADSGFTEVRIIHGKGMGALRRTVQAILERHPRVAAFREAEPESGGWGATKVFLKDKEK